MPDEALAQVLTTIRIAKHERCTIGEKEVAGEPDQELLSENVKLAKQVQKQEDQLRSERKLLRHAFRAEHPRDTLLDELSAIIDSTGFTPSLPQLPLPVAPTGNIGILQLSDLHFNKCIDLFRNQFTFEVAARRLRYHVDQSMKYWASRGVDRVVIAMTGDLMTSDRRLDESSNITASRGLAVFTAVDILQQIIQQVAAKYPVSVLAVVGNESRLGAEFGKSDRSLSDNFDYIIFGMLERLLGRLPSDRVSFIHGDIWELPVRIKNKIILFSHMYAQRKDAAKYATMVKGRFAAKGLLVSYIIGGHIHEASISDGYARSGGLPGADAYSERDLNLDSRASQNAFVVSDTGIDGLKVDLQEVPESYPGYSFRQPELQEKTIKQV